MRSFTDTFIKHPVLAVVVNLVIVLVGWRALTSLPVPQRDAGAALVRLLVLHQVCVLGVATAVTLLALLRTWRGGMAPARDPALPIALRAWYGAAGLWLLALPLLHGTP